MTTEADIDHSNMRNATLVAFRITGIWKQAAPEKNGRNHVEFHEMWGEKFHYPQWAAHLQKKFNIASLARVFIMRNATI